VEIAWTAAIRRRKELAIKRADLPQIDGVSHPEPSFARAIANHSPSRKSFAQPQSHSRNRKAIRATAKRAGSGQG
jgi:hypothetical protein